MKKRLFIFFGLILTSLSAATLPDTIDISQSHDHIGNAMLVYEDKSATIDFNKVIQLPSNSFKRLNKDVFSSTFTSSAYWFRFDVNNTTGRPLSRLFVFEPPWLDSIQVNILSGHSPVSSYEVGNSFDYAQRTLDHHLINFKHIFQPGLSSVYMQVKTRDPFIVSLSLMEERVFLNKQRDKALYVGLIYGILLAMMLYNFFLFLGIKEPYYAYYVLFVAAFFIMNASYNGYTFKPFFAHAPELQNWLQASSIFLYSLTALLFAKSFLNLKSTHIQLYSTTLSMIYAMLFIAAVSAITGGYRYHVILAIVMSVIVSLYIFFLAFFSWRHGNRSARFFILGFFSGLIGTVITALTVMGQITYSEFTYKALDIGVVVDAILLSLALADKMKITNEQKILAEKASRTDALTGLLNRRAYDEISAKEFNRSVRYQTALSFITFDINNFKHFNDTFGHHAGDKTLQHFADLLIRIKRQSDSAFRLGGDEFIILMPETEESEAMHLANRIQEHIKEEKVSFEHHTLSITVSFGVAQRKEDDISLNQLEKRADQALYKAKELRKT